MYFYVSFEMQTNPLYGHVGFVSSKEVRFRPVESNYRRMLEGEIKRTKERNNVLRPKIHRWGRKSMLKTKETSVIKRDAHYRRVVINRNLPTLTDGQTGTLCAEHADQ